MPFQWWCVAQAEPWTWAWRPYPGVWVFVLALAGAYAWGISRAGDDASPGRIGWLVAGLACLWGGLDWPLAALGASYLASAHVAQFILVGVAAPALLLLALPPSAYRWVEGRARLRRVLGWLTHPVPAFVIFNVGMTLTHWPPVTDALMVSALGSFALDMAWIVCGVIFWWPLLAPVPERPGFHPLLRIAYLALNALLIRPPFLMMVFSEYPIYGIYELAPPFPGTDPVNDQQLAGAVMKLGTAWIMGAAVAVEFIRWVRRERARDSASQRSAPDAGSDTLVADESL